MIAFEKHGDVTRLRMATWRSRLAGYDVSAFLVRGVLVDTGFAAVAPALDAWLRDARRRYLHGAADEGLMSAVVTHAHEDHSGNAGLLQERGVPVWIAPATRESFRAMQPIAFYRKFTWGTPLPIEAPSARTAAAAIPLPDGIEVLHAPGHTDDHHVVWDATTASLFGGDLFLGVKVRVAHHTERPRALAATLRRLAALEPIRLFDAHRGLVDHPEASMRAKADWIDEIVATITRLAADGMPAARIRDEVLGREPAEYYVSFNEYSKLRLVECVLAEEPASGER